MPHQTFQLAPEVLRELLIPPYWDPIPPWLDLDRERLQRFAELEIQFKIRELQIQQEKLQEFGKVIG
jgi:hypothetical protein